MAKYKVSFNTWAGGTITVETDETDPAEIVDVAMFEGAPALCAQCSGWGRDHSLEIGDELEPTVNEDGTFAVWDEKGDPYRAPEA